MQQERPAPQPQDFYSTHAVVQHANDRWRDSGCFAVLHSRLLLLVLLFSVANYPQGCLSAVPAAKKSRECTGAKSVTREQSAEHNLMRTQSGCRPTGCFGYSTDSTTQLLDSTAAGHGCSDVSQGGKAQLRPIAASHFASAALRGKYCCACTAKSTNQASSRQVLKLAQGTHSGILWCSNSVLQN
jgi:hypothetical protein